MIERLSAESSIVTFERLVQPLNISLPIDQIWEGEGMLLREVQFVKTPFWWSV